MLSDIEIAESAKLQDIREIAKNAGLSEDWLEPYGKYKAKLSLPQGAERNAKLILVTAINPTSSGEGKTTVSIGLADGLQKIGKKACLALREPSLGPVFGIKGGAAGGGYSQVIPMEEVTQSRIWLNQIFYYSFSFLELKSIAEILVDKQLVCSAEAILRRKTS